MASHDAGSFRRKVDATFGADRFAIHAHLEQLSEQLLRFEPTPRGFAMPLLQLVIGWSTHQ